MRKKILLAVLTAAMLCGGCQFVKEIETGNTEDGDRLTGEILQVADSGNSMEAIMEAMAENLSAYSLEELIKMAEYFDAEEELAVMDAEEQVVVAKTSDTRMIHIEYVDRRENGRGDSYHMISHIWDHINAETVDCGLREYFPKEDLEICSKEEALEFCAPIAEAFGYGEAEVSVYAMNLDSIRNIYEDNKENWELESPTYEEGDSSGGWTKDLEAILIIYKPYLKDLVVESSLQRLQLIYVPKYDKVVYAYGEIPWKLEKVKAETEIISSSEAVSRVLLSYGLSEVGENIEILDTGLVYTYMYKEFLEDHSVTLCWRVDYHLIDVAGCTENEAYRTMLIDAETGVVRKMLEGR